jgi:uncharacterized protein (TIGR00730 family)
MNITSIAVFCGSKPGKDPLFAQHTIELGQLIAAQKMRLVYGGGKAGLMGLIADTVLAGGATVLGIIPELLMEWETYHKGITELRTVANMHVRKKMMYENCDAAIILPGGFGTLDEFFEMLTWNQLKIHNKRIFLLNSGGFYNHLIEHLRSLEKEGFLYDRLDDRITICDTPAALFTSM